MSEFGKRVKILRLKSGLSQKKLGEKLNVSRTAINDWENRGIETNFTTLMEIAKFFNVTTDYLLGKVDEL